MTMLGRALLRTGGASSRRMKRHQTLRFRSVPRLEFLEDRQLLATSVSTFESFGLAPDTFLNDAGPSGEFVDAGNAFNNDFSSAFGGIWSGLGDLQFDGHDNSRLHQPVQRDHGFGGDGSPDTYGVAFTFGGASDPFHPAGSFVNLASGAVPVSIDVTNTTYAFLSMQNGDLFAKKFGAGDSLPPDRRGFQRTGRHGDESRRRSTSTSPTSSARISSSSTRGKRWT